MKTIWISIVFCLASLSGPAQNIQVTFTASGEATTIDSVTATNQMTNQTVTFPGDAILVLKQTSGIQDVMQFTDRIMVYPNPFAGNARIVVAVGEPQNANVRIQNLTGQVITHLDQFLPAGGNEFELSLAGDGFYFFFIETDNGYQGCKLVSLASSGQENKILYHGVTGDLTKPPGSAGVKNLHTGYSLGFTTGDVIHYACYSGVMTTIFTDSPVTSHRYEVEFAGCTDPDGKNYKVVKIGNQIWMEENLAYLPFVSPSDAGSDSLPHCYVYGYEGASVTEAKATDHWASFGALYNWPAAMNGASGSMTDPVGVRGICPDGWHLPGDAEWSVLNDYLILNGFGFEDDRLAIGKSMASCSGWIANSNQGAVGNGQPTNNRSGFNAFPASSRIYNGYFGIPGQHTLFWSSTPAGSSLAWFWGLHYTLDVLVHGYTNAYRQEGFSVRCVKDKKAYGRGVDKPVPD